MKPNFALDLTHDGISLLFRDRGGWARVGSVALDDPKMTDHLKQLRELAEELGEGTVRTKLVIPDSQILYTTLEAPGPDDVAREVQIRVALEGMTPYPVSDLVFDWRAEGDVARVAVLANETMEEAEGFANQFGFNPVSFAARPTSGQFSGEPFFGKTRSAARILGSNEKVVPDATPVPRNPRQLDLPGAPVAESAPPEPPQPAPGPMEPPAQAEAEVDPAPAAPETEKPATPPEPSEPKAAKPAASAKPAQPKAPAASRKARASSETPVLAPFPPTPDDPAEGATPTYRPVARTEPGTTPPPPKRPNGAAPLRADNSAPDASDAPPAPKAAPAPAVDAPAFSSRRSEPAPAEETPQATPEPAAPAPEPEAPKAKVAAPAAPQPETPAQPEAKTETPKKTPPVIDDTGPGPRILSGEAETRRQAMARALGASNDQPEKANGLLSRVTTGLGGISAATNGRFKRLRTKEETEGAPALDAAPVPPKPAKEPKPAKAPKPEKAAKTDKPAGRFKRKPKTEEPDPRAKEAEALTVFGARQAQAYDRGRPRYLGLILTLVLLLLMAAAALWSTVFLGDEEVALFNPGTPDDIVTEEAPAAEPAPEETPEPETASVLSVEEAEAQYAVTGVYQRAPEALGEPETAAGDEVYVASIDPTVEATDAVALPATPRLAAPTDTAIPPPPPGTTFDLNDEGLVVATPDGAVSPTGVIVTRGRPPVVPAPRPADLVPEQAETQDDAALDLPRLDPRERPENLNELAERARLGGQTREELAALRPPKRPEDLAASIAEEEEADLAEAEALNDSIEDAVAEIAIVDPTELAVEASRRPEDKPSNFSAVVAAAREQEDNSDGSQVVAAAARPQPSIPTAASVARTATMKNALNLRDLNLIGIYGSSASRRALVRMGNGRYVKVSVGDRLDGGRVVAIDDSRLVYQKGNRQLALEVLPLG